MTRIDAPLRALVVGDRFISADLFARALGDAAEEANLSIAIKQLQLDYPATASISLPTVAAARGAEIVCRRVVAHLATGTLAGSLNKPALETAAALGSDR